MNVIKFYDHKKGKTVRVLVSQKNINVYRGDCTTPRQAYIWAIQQGLTHRRLKHLK